MNKLNKKYKSPVWKSLGPFVHFTSTGTGTTEHQGKCSIEDFEKHSEQEYQVQFYSNLGPKIENQLAFYWIKCEYF